MRPNLQGKSTAQEGYLIMTFVIGTDKRIYSADEVAQLSLEIRWELFPYCDEDYMPYVPCKYGFFDHSMCCNCGAVIHTSTYVSMHIKDHPWYRTMAVCMACYAAHRTAERGKRFWYGTGTP